MQKEQACSSNLQDSGIFSEMNFFLGKDLSEDTKKELTRFVTESKGYIFL